MTDCLRTYCVALTFSGGPTPGVTADILDVLRTEEEVASFCVVGARIAQAPSLVARMDLGGHYVCNQGYTNTPFTALSAAAVARELRRTDDAITAAGAPRPKYVRAPAAGFRAGGVDRPAVAWSVEGQDAQYTDPEYLAAEVIEQARPGSIILLHDTFPWTADALPMIITGMRSRGLQMVTMESLLWQEGLKASQQVLSGPSPEVGWDEPVQPAATTPSLAP